MRTLNGSSTARYFSKFLFSIFTIALIFSGCNKDEPLDEVLESVEESQDPMIQKYFLGGQVLVKEESDGTFSLAGSDARLFADQLSDSPTSFIDNPLPDEGRTQLALAGGIRKWTGNTVAYVLSGLSSSVRSELQKSINEWEGKTNVRFVPRSNQSNYITISSSGSNSNSGVATLGMNGSRGYIRLGTRATAEVIIHELGHTLGYIHEQNRADRDDYIIINFSNIQNNAKDQFYKSNSAVFLSNNFDVNSTMMYGSYTFSKNGRPTITDLNGNLLPSRRARISSLDVSGTNRAYPLGTTGGGDDACSSADEWSPNKRYSVGDKVTYRGGLYERDFTRWNYIKQCG